MRLAVVMPVYNECSTLRTIVARVEATPPPMAPRSREGYAARAGGRGVAEVAEQGDAGGAVERVIVLVDDGSTDGSGELVRELGQRPGVRALVHERNRGKGAAIRTGFAAALEAGADVVLIQDADLEYDPADHAAVLTPILDGRADAVIGSRFLGQAHRVLYYWHWVANTALTQFSNMLSNLNLTDMECGTKAFTRAVVERLRLREDRFGIEPELVARVARLRLPGDAPAGAGRDRPVRIFEVPVSYAGRTYEEGKKITWRDGVSALRCIVRYNLMD